MAETLPPTPDMTNTRQPSPSMETPTATSSFSWWSWRPGTSPIHALLLGLPLMLLTALLFFVGFYTLISGIVESVSSRIQHSINLPGSLFLLLLGMLLLPYTLFLTFGGWHDLRGQRRSVSGKIIATRTTATNVLRQGRPARPGLASGFARPWYGMALQPFSLPEQAQRIVVFRLSEEFYRDLREGAFMRVVYTSHLHHVTSLREIDAI